MLSPRMQRWALTLTAYEYKIIHRPSQSIPQADALSRLPVDGAPKHVPDNAVFGHVPVIASGIRRETARDSILSQVFIITRDGFPQRTSEAVHPKEKLAQRSQWLSHVGHQSDNSKCLPTSTAGRTAQGTL